MDSAFIISGAGHAALIGVLLFGGLFRGDTAPPIQTTDVSILSEEEFAALTRPETGAPSAPAASSEPEPAPEAEPAPETTVDTAPPSEPDPSPDPAPVPATPEATPPPASRVADEVQPAPPIEAEQAPETTPAPAPEPAADADVVEEIETPTAPAESTTEIVTEAERPDVAAPTVPPRARPERPTETVRADPEPVPEPDPAPADTAQTAPRTEGSDSTASSSNVQDAVNQALAGLEETAPEQGAPAGPPLTAGERDGLRIAVQRCWVVDVGSEAAGITVTVGVALDRDGRVAGPVREISNDGSGPAARTAFESARRAVLRCESGGYDLPPEKYDRWRDVEITFNPDDMRRR